MASWAAGWLCQTHCQSLNQCLHRWKCLAITHLWRWQPATPSPAPAPPPGRATAGGEPLLPLLLLLPPLLLLLLAHVAQAMRAFTDRQG